jgi:hypothetical protein
VTPQRDLRRTGDWLQRPAVDRDAGEIGIGRRAQYHGLRVGCAAQGQQRAQRDASAQRDKTSFAYLVCHRFMFLCEFISKSGLLLFAALRTGMVHFGNARLTRMVEQLGVQIMTLVGLAFSASTAMRCALAQAS